MKKSNKNKEAIKKAGGTMRFLAIANQFAYAKKKLLEKQRLRDAAIIEMADLGFSYSFISRTFGLGTSRVAAIANKVTDIPGT